MAWKILSGIAAALLGVSLYFAVVNGKALKTEKMLADRAEKDLAATLARKKQGEEMKETKLAQVETAKKELVVTKEKVTKAAAEAQEKDAGLQLAKNTLAQVSQQVDTIQKKIDELGDVNKLLAQVDALKKEQQAADAELASQTQQLAVKQEATVQVQKQVISLRDLEARARKGVVEPGFTARLASVFGEWGFVILNKGNNGGVFANADLEVKRGHDVVAKLKVRNVEQNSAIADVVPGSVTDGERLRSGDLVFAAATQSAATPAAPKDGKADAAPADAGGGAPAPAAPAAAMGASDPFAASPMPAGGAAAPAPAAGGAMGGDPFGGAAPAPPAAGAAPGGAGTKESPSTADPFNPAPAGGAPATPPAGNAEKDPFAK